MFQQKNYSTKSIFIQLILLLINITQIQSQICRGCTELDDLTFNKLINKFQFTIVKFDIAFPYGEKHNVYVEFAQELSENYDDLLIGVVGVKDYGEKDNSLLAKRFNIDINKFPIIKLFQKNQLNDSVQFPNDFEMSVENLKKFLRDNTDMYIGLDGCIRELDQLTITFMRNINNDKISTNIYEQLTTMNYYTEKEKNSLKMYTTIMKRILADGITFLTSEGKRLKNLLENGQINDKKKIELIKRTNIIKIFEKNIKLNDDKSEL